MLMLPASYAYCQQDLAKAYSLQRRLRSLAANEQHVHRIQLVCTNTHTYIKLPLPTHTGLPNLPNLLPACPHLPLRHV